MTLRKKINITRAELMFNEYLAGVIDGDGCFSLSKKGYPTLEITMDVRDEVCLHYIKHNVGGGTIKPRSGVKAVRFRLHNKRSVEDIVNRINGLVRYPQRIIQLKKLCNLYGIEYIESTVPTKKTAYFAGIFDSDGTITCSLKKPKHVKWAKPQLTISVSSKNKDDLDILVAEFNGNIYKDDKGKYVSYKWSIQSKQDILIFINYLNKFPLHTLKKNRVLMVPEYYRLYELHAFKPENTVLRAEFNKWLEMWSSYGYSRNANLSLSAGEIK